MLRFGIMSFPRYIQGYNIFLILGDSNTFQNMLLQRKCSSEHGVKMKKFDVVLLARENLTSLQSPLSTLGEELSHVSTEETASPDASEKQLVARAKNDQRDRRSYQSNRRRSRYLRHRCLH